MEVGMKNKTLFAGASNSTSGWRLKPTTLDWKLICGLTLVAALLFCYRFWPAPSSGLIVRVECAGRTVREFELQQFTEQLVTVGFPRGYVKLAVRDGAVCVREVWPPELNPRKICILMGWIRRPGEQIICVPAGLTVRLVGARAPEIDVIAR
jgi:hypothetical protein